MGNTQNEFNGRAHNVVQGQTVHLHFQPHSDGVKLEKLKKIASPSANLPARNPNFVGRDRFLDILGDHFSSSEKLKVVAIRGLGGVGKSELALEYAQKGYSSCAYEVVWWVRAESKISMVEDLSFLAVALGVTAEEDRENMAKLALSMLDDLSNWLLIYDDAISFGVVSEMLPGRNGDVLVTSREPDWSRIASTMDLTPFRRLESVELIMSRTNSNEQSEAALLAECLDDLPLAIAQASCYIDIRQISVRRYRELYDSAQIEMLNRGLDSAEYPRSVATTWLMHFNELIQKSPESMDLLRLCAFLGAESIPLDLLLSDVLLVPESLEDAVGDQMHYEDMVMSLVRANLITSVDANRVNVHRLVQLVTRSQLDENERIKWTCYAAVSLCGALLQIDDVLSDKARLLMTHANAVARHVDETVHENGNVGSLLEIIGLLLRSQSQSGQFLDIGEESYEWKGAAATLFRESVRNSANSLWGISVSNEAVIAKFLICARLFHYLGEHSKYRSALERTQKIAEARLPPGDSLSGGVGKLLDELDW